MNSELFSWGTRVPVSTALRGKPGLELSNEIQDSLSEVKWNMFGLEFFLVLGALLFLFTCYQVIKIGRILDEIQDKLSEVKRGERVGAKRKYGTQNKYTGLSKGLEPEEKFRSGKNTWREIRRKRGKREKKKDQLAEVSRKRSLCSSLDELRKPALSSSEADEEFSSEETDWEEEAAHYQPANWSRKKPKAAGESQRTVQPQGSRLQGPPYAESPPCVVRQQCAERQCADSFIAPRKNKGLQDWLRVCRELGGPLTNAGLAAAILQSQNRSMSRNDQRTCFNCGKPGHFMQHLGLILSNENAPSGGYSTKAKNIMAKMGYKEGKGLGHQEQGRIEPISPNGNQDRQGLGFP